MTTLLSLAERLEQATAGSKPLGFLVRLHREDRGWSLSELAKLSGITKAHIWEIEVGRATNPTVDTLMALSNALQCKPVSLFLAAVRNKQ